MPLLIVLFLCSGATGLVYELVWTRELIFVFGGTTYAITTVLVAFMGGLGLGSFVAGRLTRRMQRPGQVYGLIEILIGGYALAVPFLLDLAEPMYRALYPFVAQAPGLLTGLRFCVGAAALLIPTTLMGATLPILVRHLTIRGGKVGAAVGLLYGVNSLGATAGVIGAGFLLIPTFGLERTTQLAAAVNIIIGCIAVLALRTRSEPIAESALDQAPRSAAPAMAFTPVLRRAIFVTCAASGFAAMAYQIAWTRTLVMTIGSSTYSFTCILAAFILGLALGSLAAMRVVDRWPNPGLAVGVMQILIGLAAVLVLPLEGYAPVLVYKLLDAFTGGYESLLFYEFVLIIAITFVPTFFMGTLFPFFTRIVVAGPDDAGAATGRMYGVNTLGTVLGSFLAGFFLIRSSVLGVQNTILVAALLNALLGVWLLYLSAPAGAPKALRTLAGAAAVVAMPIVALLSRWDPYLMSAGPFIVGMDPRTLRAETDITFFGEGVDLTVAVTRSRASKDILSLRVNAKTDASTSLGDMQTQLLLGHLPLLLHGHAKSACVIGLGSGMTLGAVARHERVEQIDSVEISSVVIDAAREFSPYNDNVLADQHRVRMIRADGRNHLLLTGQSYDVIISVPSNPWIAGVANLFTREYFELCRGKLRPDGRLCFWMQGYMMSLDDFKLVVRTLADVFDYVSLWEMGPDFMLIAGRDPLSVPLDAFLERCRDPRVRQDLYRAGLGHAARLLGRFVGADEAIREWAGPGRLHSDDNALLEFSAPTQMLRPDEIRIAAAVDEIRTSPFASIVQWDQSDPRHHAVRDEVQRMQKATRMLIGTLEAQRDGADLPELLRRLLAAKQTDAQSVRIHQQLVSLKSTLVGTDAGRDREVRELLDSIDDYRAPTASGQRFATFEQIAAMLRQRASNAGIRGRWNLATSYLEEAYELAGDDAGVAINYAIALLNADRRDRALDVIENGIRAGLFSADQIAASEWFAPLIDDARFRALRAAD